MQLQTNHSFKLDSLKFDLDELINAQSNQQPPQASIPNLVVQALPNYMTDSNKDVLQDTLEQRVKKLEDIVDQQQNTISVLSSQLQFLMSKYLNNNCIIHTIQEESNTLDGHTSNNQSLASTQALQPEESKETDKVSLRMFDSQQDYSNGPQMMKFQSQVQLQVTHKSSLHVNTSKSRLKGGTDASSKQSQVFKDNSSRTTYTHRALRQSSSNLNVQSSTLRSQQILYDSSDSDETITTNSKQEEVKQFDVAFLHADVLVKKANDKIQAMNQNQQLSADVMYKKMVDQMNEHKKKFFVRSRSLSLSVLRKVLSEKPKVLVLNCHGGFQRNITATDAIKTYLCFEDEDQPTLLQRVDEPSLANLVRGTSVQLVILSACHSSHLAQVLIDAGVPVVVSIIATVGVLEKAAEKFNAQFMWYLCKGYSPKVAFEHSQNVLLSDNQTSGICCCSHDHLPDCLWIKLKDGVKDKNGATIVEAISDYEAHKIHKANCKCSKLKDYGPIDHHSGCSQYQNFYSKLCRTIEDTNLILDKNQHQGFLQPPLQSGSPGRNKMCCCHSDFPHNESQKFLIMGSESAQNTPLFDLSQRQDGLVIEDLPIDQKFLPDWLRKESNWLFDRNILIHQVVQFLVSKKRLLQVTGTQLSGRTAVINRAIKIVISRKNSHFNDGIFMVDLENVGQKSLVQRISEQLRLHNPKPTEDSLIRDLIGLKSLIFFSDCQMISSQKTQKEFLKFLSRVIQQTYSVDGGLKFIIIMKQKYHNYTYDWDQQIEIGPMSREGKILLFIHLMKLQDRHHLLPSEEVLQTHEIFNLVDPQYITRIVHDYESVQSLDIILKDLQLRLVKQKSEKHKQEKFKQESYKLAQYNEKKNLRIRSLLCADLLKQVPEDFILEKNLIYFLTLTPAGLSQTEVQQLCKIYKKWFGCNHQLLQSIQKIDTETKMNESVTIIETKSFDQTYLQLVEVLQYQDLATTPVFRIQKDYLSALELLLDHTPLQIKDGVQMNRRDLVSITIEFMGSQARSILRSIKKNERSGAVDYRLVGAHLDCGMWYRYPNEEEFFDEEIELAEQRFTLFYLTNFKHLLDEEMLKQNFPEIWSDKLSQESEYIYDLCVTVPSILVQLGRYEEAIEVIQQCRTFGSPKKLFMHGYLDLMLASIYVFSNTNKPCREIMQLIKSARKIFKNFNVDQAESDDFLNENIGNIKESDDFFKENIGYIEESDDEENISNIEGYAETYFVQALLYMQVYKNTMKFDQNHTYKKMSSGLLYSNQPLINKSSSITRNNTFHLGDNQIQNLGIGIYDESCQLDIFGSIQYALKKAFKSFERIEDNSGIQTNNKEFGKAKTILAEADFVINYFQTFQLRYQNDFIKEDFMIKLQRAEELFSMREQVKFDQSQHTNYQNGLQIQATNSNNYKVNVICLQAQLQLLKVGTHVSNHDELKEARNIIDKAIGQKLMKDDNLVQLITQIKNKILYELRTNSHNLFTFAKAWPLVVKDSKDMIRSIGDFTTSRFEFAPDVISAFQDTGLDLQIKFDLLNDDLIRNVVESGSRVLHLTSDIFARDYLYIEDKIGICKQIHKEDLNAYFRSFKVGSQFNSKRLPVDCVVLAIPNSEEIGAYFNEFGVRHVVTFKIREECQQLFETEAYLMPIRYNYIYTFCQRFYISLVQDLTVREAFQQALEFLNDENIKMEKIWGNKDFKDHDLGIEPTLLDQDNECHDLKLFDSKALNDEKQFLKKGKLYDITKARGLLVGMQKSSDPYIGNHELLHQVMAILTDQVHVRQLCHIKGRKGVGKTRFLKEVAYYLYRRGHFAYKIMYQDLQEIKVGQAFEDMFLEKDLNDKRTGYQQQVPILLVFDNIDLLNKEFSQRFEARMIDLIRKNPGVRFLTSSTRKWTFEKFNSELSLSESKNEVRLKMAMKTISILNDIQAVDLLLSACTREITRHELDMDDKNKYSIHYQLQLEEKVSKCQGKPLYLMKLAEKLNEGYDFNEVKMKVSTQYQQSLKKETIQFYSEQNKGVSHPKRNSFASNSMARFEFINPLLGASIEIQQDSQGETPQRSRTNTLDCMDLGDPILKRDISALATHEDFRKLFENHKDNQHHNDYEIREQATSEDQIWEEMEDTRQRSRKNSDYVEGEMYVQKMNYKSKFRPQNKTAAEMAKTQKVQANKRKEKERKVDRYATRKKVVYGHRVVPNKIEEEDDEAKSLSPTLSHEGSKLGSNGNNKSSGTKKKPKKLSKAQQDQLEDAKFQKK